ncbi:Transducin/WD40 repeat-like superfamily protein [Forsythia ovata]|uniref:Transducin/WD40 repeat-like superfamily protein n=1 Tax=Forsythia ovata TaxID=205694 RepID=A0ABD1X151_9LAMI
MERRTLTMNWDDLGEADDECFFESRERMSSAVPLDLAALSGSDEDDEFEDSRMSFASAISAASMKRIGSLEIEAVTANSSSVFGGYDMWMAEPGDIKERRKRLFQGFGLNSNKDFLRVTTAKFVRGVSIKPDVPPHVSKSMAESSPSEEPKKDEAEPEAEAEAPIVLVRSRSDGDIESFSMKTKKRKEELIGPVSKQRLTRTSSGQIAYSTGVCQYACSVRISQPKRARTKSALRNSELLQSVLSPGAFDSFFLIKNLDTGNEFIVKESNEKGMWNKLNDVQTGKQLTMEEFEKSVGYSRFVKELMGRANVSRSLEDARKVNLNSYLTKSFRNSKRMGASFLKNIMGVANTMSGKVVDKEGEHSSQSSPVEHRANKTSSQWIKAHQYGKSYKEFSALHMSQEIQAHDGSIWTIKFSWDACFLASTGEDGIIHVWEVQECDVMPRRSPDNTSSPGETPVRLMAGTVSDRPPLAEITPMPSEMKRRGRNNRKKGNSIPDYVSMPDTVFALSEKPFCTFEGHQDEVLDLSWSRSQLLLSSSMDKTVRLWDLETKSCLKMFAHNDYVTCIQFNPVDEDYFISGSLDGKVRIWSISDRQVVDWTDLHEMVTAACYTPDGQGAIIGSHKGICRLYTIDDCKLEQKDQIDIQCKKKSHAKKITGFQFSPQNPSELLITSADSQIRVYDGTELVQKLRGFRNTSSQILATFTANGRYAISASEDSQVYIWKFEDSRNEGGGKSRSRTTIQTYEHFPCKDVSAAIAWPGSIKNEPPIIDIHSKRHSKHSSTPQPCSTSGSPTREDNMAGDSCKRHLPPLPKKNNVLEKSPSYTDEDFAQSARIHSENGISELFGSSSSSIRYGDSPSISASGTSGSQSWSSSWSLFDGGISHGGQTIQATAWGLVIITANVGGQIRVYQNFGLPLKVSRQTNLFMS